MDDYGTTHDGVRITPGLIVFTNEFRVGKVVEGSLREHNPGWFDVEYRNGAKAMQSPDRVATHFTGQRGLEVAKDVYATEHDWTFPHGVRTCALCGTTTERAPGVPHPCPKAPGKVTLHSTMTYQTLSGSYFVGCRCPWASGPHDTRNQARTAGDQHLQEENA